MNEVTKNNQEKTIKVVKFKSHPQELKFINEALIKNKNGQILNEEKYSKFYEQYHKFVFSIAYKITKDPQEAEDIVHDVFIKCVDEYRQYDQEKRFKPWLGAITKNHSINEMKKKSSRPTHYVGIIHESDYNHNNNNATEDDLSYFNAVDEKIKTPYENAKNKEKRQIINKSLEKLKEEFKEVIKLKYFEGLQYEEIAEKINVPIGTVMSRIYNAKRKLKEELIKDGVNNTEDLYE